MTTRTKVGELEGPVRVPGRVVAAFDGTPISRAAVAWAAREAGLRGSSLRIVDCCVVRGSAGFDGAGAQLDALATPARLLRQDPALNEDLSACVGPLDALIDGADDADLLVVGASESSRANGWLLRSVQRPASRRSRCPVVVVRGDGVRAISRIVVGVDSSSAATAALDWASDEAARHGAELVVVHAWQQPPIQRSLRGSDLARAEARCIADLAADRCRARQGGAVRAKVVEGSAAAALIEESRRADLLAIGSRGRSGFRTMLFGSVALAVVAHAHCPVAVTHPQPDPTSSV